MNLLPNCNQFLNYTEWSRAVTIKHQVNERWVGEITELEALEINIALFWKLDLISFLYLFLFLARGVNLFLNHKIYFVLGTR